MLYQHFTAAARTAAHGIEDGLIVGGGLVVHRVVVVDLANFPQPFRVDDLLHQPAAFTYEQSAAWRERLAVRRNPREILKSCYCAQTFCVASLAKMFGWRHR